MKKLAMVVRDDAFDNLLTPLTFAHSLASRGVTVDMLFVLWAVRVLTPEGAAAVRMSDHHAADEGWLRNKLAEDGDAVDIATFLGQLTDMENINIYGCQYAASTFEVSEDTLIAGVNGIVNPAWFITEKAGTADHCQYF